jgi:hypothetical protein
MAKLQSDNPGQTSFLINMWGRPMPKRRPAVNTSEEPMELPSITPAPAEPELDARELAIRLENELIKCKEPAAVADWCDRAYAVLSRHLDKHEEYRLHHGDSVCHIFARAAYTLARSSPFCPVELVGMLGPLPLVQPSIAGHIALANIERLGLCAKAQLKTSTPERPPLSPNEQRVLDLIRAQPPGTGIVGRHIVSKLSKEGFELDHGTLTRHIIPILKRHFGVKNRPGIGYYCDQRASAP